MPSDWIAEATR